MRRLPTACLLVLSACPGKHHDMSSSVTQAACATPVRESVLPPEMVQDLGTLQVGDLAEFVVTAGTASFFIFSQEVDGSAVDNFSIVSGGKSFTIPNSVVPTNLRSPSGILYYDDFASLPTDTSGLLAFDAGWRPVSEALPVPNTSGALRQVEQAGEVEPGVWTFTVNDWARECLSISECTGGSTSGKYRVHVVTRPGYVPSSGGGTLDLEVYLATDETGVLPNAVAAEGSSRVARWILAISQFLGNAGITVGQVSFHDVAPEVKSRYAPNGTVDLTNAGDPCSDLNQLFTAAVAPKRAVHLFLAEDLVEPSATNDGRHIAGVDGSIPGPSGFPGTVYGGAIVGLFGELDFGSCTGATDLASCGPDFLGYVAAHEIGHWLGLYHPTEQDGAFFDPISDTARCPCSSCGGTSCGTSNAYVLPSQCTGVSSSCGGGRNLMFWFLDENISTGELSVDQSQIVSLNPAVQ